MFLNSSLINDPSSIISDRNKDINHLIFYWLDLGIFFFLDFIYLFLDRREGTEKDKKKSINVWLPLMPLTESLAHNPGQCPDWESTLHPLVLRPGLSTLSHTSQGMILELCWKEKLSEVGKENRFWEKKISKGSYVCILYIHIM